SNTIIDGSQPSHPDSGSVVTFNSGEDTTSVLCGFTITGGTGTFIPAVPLPFNVRIGGGIYIGANVSASVLNNIIKHNNILTNDYAAGGGIYSDDPGGNGFSIIENNKIRNNSILGGNQLIMGGGICMGGSGRIINNYIIENTCQSMGSSLGAVGGGVKFWTLDGSQDTTSCLIENNIISDNRSISVNGTAYAGGINSSNCVITMRNNVVCNNTAESTVQSIGAGMHVGGLIYLESRIENNRFTGNHFIGTGTSYGGGLYINNSILVVINNIFNDNEADYGGGLVLNSNSQPQIVNNTLVSNSATYAGGGISSYQSTLTMMNSILWGNSAIGAHQIFISGGTDDVTYSDVQGGWTGTGNIDLNPELVDTVLTSGDTLFSILSIGSPCIDAGNSDPMFYDPEDPNNPGYALWPSMGTIGNDMGAYGGPGAISWIITDVNDERELINDFPVGFHLSQNYPNPFNPSTKIQYSVNSTQKVTLKVYDLLGSEIATLVSEEKPAGSYELIWTVANLPSGVYFYQLRIGSFVETKKMILLK
ncbi:MAG: T9SS type A sorting domain-containing protein, partial [Ignavibacteriaceae bacterium]